MAIFTGLSLLLPASLGSLTIFGLSPAVTAAVFSVGRSVLWSMAAQALAPKPQVPRQQIMANITQTDQPRVRAYGRVLLGGPRAFWEADADGGALYQLIVIHHGRVAGLIDYWVDGEPVTVNADNAVTSPPFETGEDMPDIILGFRNGRNVPASGGDGNGGDVQQLRDKFPALWTVNHRLTDQATVYVRMDLPKLERLPKIFPKGANTIFQAEVNASLVRVGDGSLAYSENPSWATRDYLTHQDGWRIDAAFMDDAGFLSFAALCNEAVPLATGGTEPRYRVSGYYTLDDAPKEVTGRLLNTCDGQVYQTAEGLVSILGGRWSEPDVTITDADIMAFEAEDGFDPFTDFNVLKGTFISPAHGYQPTEVAELRDSEALLTQPERTERIEFDMVPSGPQTQRLMKIAMAKRRRLLSGKLTTNLVGIKARFPKGDGIHTIRLDAPDFGLVGVFEVTSHRFSIPEGWCEIGIGSIADPYGWNAAVEERALPPSRAALERPVRDIPPPANPALSQVPVLLSGDIWGGKLRLTVTPSIRGDLDLEAQVAAGDIAVTAAADWARMAGDRFSAETGILSDGQPYTVRFRWRGQGTWQRAGTVTIVANPIVPDPPSSLAAVGTELRWRNPTTNFLKSRVFRNTTNNFTGSTFVSPVEGLAGQMSAYTDAPGGGTYYYWVVAMNPSYIASDPAGPVSITF